MATTTSLPRILQRLTEVTIVVVLAITGFVVIATMVTDAGLDMPIEFTPDVGSYTIASDSLGSGTILDAVGTARFEDRDAALTVAYLSGVLVYMVPSVALLALLRRFLRHIADGKPFERDNALVLRWIGLIIIGFGVLAQSLRMLMVVVAMNTLTTEGIHLEARLDPDLTVVFIGLVVLVIAEAFRRGTQLQSDVDLTV